VLTGLSITFTDDTTPRRGPRITHSAPCASESHPTTIHASSALSSDAPAAPWMRARAARLASCTRRTGARAGETARDDAVRGVFDATNRAARVVKAYMRCERDEVCGRGENVKRFF